MSDAYVVGYITVKNIEKWAEYRSQVPDTLAPWGAELVFRGNQVAVLTGENPHSDIVVIRFPDIAAVNGWCTSPAYQALIPLRRQAAEMVFTPMKHSSLTLRSSGAARITPRAAP